MDVADVELELEPPRSGHALQWLLFAVALVLGAASAVLAIANQRAVAPGEFGFPGYQAVFAISEGWVGYLIATRHTRNTVGWAFLVAAVAIGVDGVAHEYALRPSPDGVPGRDLAIWVDAWAWAVNTVGLLLALYRFPDGRPVGPAWLWLERLSFALIGAALFLSAFVPGPTLSSGLVNPYGLAFLAGVSPALTNAPGSPATLLAAASLVTRFRRSRGIERQQLKWLAATVVALLSVAIVMNALQIVSPSSTAVAQITLVLAVPLVPISIGIAVLRYRLYEIDTLINRALVYGALTAILAGVYTASIGVFQRLFTAIAGEHSEGGVVLTTLLVAAAFTPLRSRLQVIVDRRFKAAPADRPGDALAALRTELATVREDVADIRRRLTAHIEASGRAPLGE